MLPTDSKTRKALPITTGVLDYFPRALAEVARVSVSGNAQHNPGQKLHWAREKSTDHADCIVRHLIDRGKIDTDGMRHSAKLAWQALALLDEELRAEEIGSDVKDKEDAEATALQRHWPESLSILHRTTRTRGRPRGQEEPTPIQLPYERWSRVRIGIDVDGVLADFNETFIETVVSVTGRISSRRGRSASRAGIILNTTNIARGDPQNLGRDPRRPDLLGLMDPCDNAEKRPSGSSRRATTARRGVAHHRPAGHLPEAPDGSVAPRTRRRFRLEPDRDDLGPEGADRRRAEPRQNYR